MAGQGWEDSQITMIKRLQPGIRQFVRVRQALVRARALETTAAALLNNPRIGVIHLDRHGRVLAANDRAGHILRQNDGLSDRDGILRALAPADQPRFQQLVATALPASVAGNPVAGRFVPEPANSGRDYGSTFQRQSRDTAWERTKILLV